jgi:hypothetical protein
MRVHHAQYTWSCESMLIKRQSLRARLRVFLFGKYNPAIMDHRTRMQTGQSTAQVVSFKPGVIEVPGHAAQRRFDGRLQRGIFSDQLPERALEPGRENQFVHGLFVGTQAGNDAFDWLRFEFASTERLRDFRGIGCGFTAP